MSTRDDTAAGADGYLAAAIAAATRPRGCPACGRTFADRSAFTVHREYGTGRCLPDTRLEGEGLVVVDGVWQRRGG
jgi:hypothetical protein